MDKSRLIPNSIGRLDPVTQAIRLGDYDIANKLLELECIRVSKKYYAAIDECAKLQEISKEVERFRREFFADHFFRLACTEEVN